MARAMQLALTQVSARRATTAAVVAFVVVAGALHLLIVPAHWDHKAHGLFLAIAGAAEVAWGVAFWLRPSAMLSRIGIVLGFALIALWAVTRFVVPPFDHEPGGLDLIGGISKVLESLGVAGLVAMAVSGTASQKSFGSSWRFVLVLGTAGVILALAIFSLGLAAEPFLPQLGEPAEHAEDGAVGLTSDPIGGTASAPTAENPGAVQGVPHAHEVH